MRAAFLNRDAAYDGLFITVVKTTGIFCRPVCTARKPKPENVEFFPTSKAALGAGYRPCLRCKPAEPAGAQPAWVEKLLARLDAAPQQRIAAADLRAAGIEPARARRHFQRVYGMTFQAFARSRRLGEAYRNLRGGASLDDAAAETGYESLSGFRDAFARLFALPPGQGRAAVCINIAWLDSPLGPLLAGATDEGICLLEFADRRMIEAQCKTLRQRLGAAAVVPGENAPLAQLRGELADYFAGKRNHFTVPLIAPGTEFQERVWAALQTIPHGQTWSYQALANAIGDPKAVRAVARANGMNRLAILIPCHRVINSGGALGGYGGGLWRKQRLLALERGERLLDWEAAATRG